MTNVRRWLSVLPPDAPERELLDAGLSAQLPDETVERGWNRLCATIGAGAATATLSAKAIATVGSTGTAAGLGVKAGLGTWGGSLVAKSVAVGFVVGFSTLGTVAVLQKRPFERSQAASTVPASARPPSRQGHAVIATPTSLPVPTATARPAEPSSSDLLPMHPSEPSVISTVESSPSSLAEQARELAQIKRSVDEGRLDEALSRLRRTRDRGLLSDLSEERDALYVDTLRKVGRNTEARQSARQFLRRYPKSPHVKRMRLLVDSE